ncbi:hypothetical protein AQUCO_01000701v1, partial [Aquilegia coerulea]
EVWRGVLKLLKIHRFILRAKEEWLWIFDQCRREDGGLIKAFLNCTLYWIWFERNARRFKEVASIAQITVEKIRREVCRLLNARKIKMKDTAENKALMQDLNFTAVLHKEEIVQCSWKLPPQNIVKINAAGSLNKVRAGYGGILRDEKGEVLCSFSAVADMSIILQLELQAIYEGVKLCNILGFRKILIASDSRNAIQRLKGEQSSPWYTRETVTTIQELCSEMEEHSYIHVFGVPDYGPELYQIKDLTATNRSELGLNPSKKLVCFDGPHIEDTLMGLTLKRGLMVTPKNHPSSEFDTQFSGEENFLLITDSLSNTPNSDLGLQATAANETEMDEKIIEAIEGIHYQKENHLAHIIATDPFQPEDLSEYANPSNLVTNPSSPTNSNQQVGFGAGAAPGGNSAGLGNNEV